MSEREGAARPVSTDQVMAHGGHPFAVLHEVSLAIQDAETLDAVAEAVRPAAQLLGATGLAIAAGHDRSDPTTAGDPHLMGHQALDSVRRAGAGTTTDMGDDTTIVAVELHHAGATWGALALEFASGDRLPTRVDLDAIADHLARRVHRFTVEAALAADLAGLRRSNEDLENYAAVVAHDLRAPVRRIGSFVQLLLREVGPLSPEAESHAAIIRDQVGHLHQVLHDVLTDAKAVTPESAGTVVDLDETMARVVEPLRADLDAVCGEVTWSDLPPVCAEAGLLRQVLQNLVDNAITYRSPDRPPRVEVTAVPAEAISGSWWRIEVRDNGIGIAPADAESVFGLFQRLDPEGDRAGSGVGLAIAKRVIERHGGTIGVEPNVGFGSCFWFTLPAPT